MTHFPPETLAVAMGVTATQARLLLGCAGIAGEQGACCDGTDARGPAAT